MNTLFHQAYAATGGRLDLSALRPFLNKQGQPVISLPNGVGADGKPVMQSVPVQNALLRRYEWEQIDAAVLDVVRAPNVALNDFLRLGLTQRLDGLGVIVSTYEQLGDMTEANVSMEGTVKGDKDLAPFIPQSIPVPIIHKDFQLSLRQLEASRRGQGGSLDTTQARVATRKVLDKVDDIIFLGNATQVGETNPIYGLTNKPQRIQKTATELTGGDWGTSGNAYKTINGAIALLREKGYYGPYGVYVASTQYAQSNSLVSGTAVSERSTISQQLPEVSFINQAHKLTDGEGIVMQLSTDVVDIAIAQDTTPVQWDGMGGFMIDFRIFTALTVRVKHDANNSCGIVHFTGA